MLFRSEVELDVMPDDCVAVLQQQHERLKDLSPEFGIPDDIVLHDPVDGFPVDPTTWQEILAAAEKLKLPRAGVEQAAQRA